MILIFAILAGCAGGEQKLIIFHAGSLSVPMQQLTEAFQAEHPSLRIETEAAGSRTSARKISELSKECDVFASADYTVIDQLLIPDFASWNIPFASNEMAIAYASFSRFSEEFGSENWYDILQREDVAYGRSDPDSDPCGYRTVLSIRLAEIHYEEPFAEKLLNKDTYLIRPKETDLLALLESRELDYLFIYRSVAQQHGLNYLELPDELNLKKAELADLYARVSVHISGKSPGSSIEKIGEPMIYGLTIPKGAPNHPMALKFVEFMLSEKGQAIMEECGQGSLVPSPSTSYEHIPITLQEFALPPR